MPKKILITGANSYVGTSFEKYMSQWPDEYQIETIDMIGDSWRNKSFSGYDVVFHVAGIAHQKETKENAHLYYEINRDLAIESAKKAKSDGVSQFIFMSSMSVYGKVVGKISSSTHPSPLNAYGKSKYEAERVLKELHSKSFKIAILRPPLIYGFASKGNFQKLLKLATLSPLFIDTNCQRSMIYIDNLTFFIRQIVDNSLEGIYLPQNEDYVNPANMYAVIRRVQGKNTIVIKISSDIIKRCISHVPVLNKLFCTLIYDKQSATQCNYIPYIKTITDSLEVKK